MELPRKILIGEGVVSQVGVLIRTLNESEPRLQLLLAELSNQRQAIS